MPVTRHNILPVAFEVKRNGIETQTNEWACVHPRMIFGRKISRAVLSGCRGEFCTANREHPRAR
jgi:hypothetical protein